MALPENLILENYLRENRCKVCRARDGELVARRYGKAGKSVWWRLLGDLCYTDPPENRWVDQTGVRCTEWPTEAEYPKERIMFVRLVAGLCQTCREQEEEER